MPSGLIALLDDVAMIAKAASASMDDIAAATAKAGSKAAGVVIDDTAVTPRYVHGLTPDRELPIIWKISLGSLRNKLLFLLPAALLLSAFAPWAITPILMIGGAYLAFEATEKIVEAVLGDHHDEEEMAEVDTPDELEKRQVKGAIRTDFILSAEIMAIALASIEGYSLGLEAAALAVVAIAITIGVYGTVALIVKLDDIGLHLAQKHGGARAALGRGLLMFVPKLLKFLSTVGVVAMLWVGGGILLHGLEEMGFERLPRVAHHIADAAAEPFGAMGGMISWLASAVAASIVGLVVGGFIVAIIRRLVSHPEKLVVDA